MAIIFIHGTSVREERLKSLLETIKDGAKNAGINDAAAIQAYAYGNSATTLRYGGLSIPGYGEAEREREAPPV